MDFRLGLCAFHLRMVGVRHSTLGTRSSRSNTCQHWYWGLDVVSVVDICWIMIVKLLRSAMKCTILSRYYPTRSKSRRRVKPAEQRSKEGDLGQQPCTVFQTLLHNATTVRKHTTSPSLCYMYVDMYNRLRNVVSFVPGAGTSEERFSRVGAGFLRGELPEIIRKAYHCFDRSPGHPKRLLLLAILTILCSFDRQKERPTWDSNPQPSA